MLRAPPLGSVSQRAQGYCSSVREPGMGAELRAPLSSLGTVGLVGVPWSWRAPCSWCFHGDFPGVAQPRLPPHAPCAVFPQLNGTSISSATPNSTVRSAFGATLYHSPTSRLPPSGGKVRGLLGCPCPRRGLGALPPLPSSGGIKAALWSWPALLGSCTAGGMSVGPAQPGGKEGGQHSGTLPPAQISGGCLGRA